MASVKLPLEILLMIGYQWCKVLERSYSMVVHWHSMCNSARVTYSNGKTSAVWGCMNKNSRERVGSFDCMNH